MRAVLCSEYGPPERLEVTELPAPEPAAGQVVVSIRAAGINFPDALLVQGTHQRKPALPFTPGAELAGVVARVGAGIDTRRIGEHVYASRVAGAFAEEGVVDAERLRPIPSTFSFEEAAALSVTYETSYYALASLAGLRADESVLVLGAAGGVGLAAVEIAKALGAHVIAAASTPEKLAVCAAHGAHALIQYGTEDLRERIREIAGSEGVDVVYDPVGGAYAERALRGLAWRGRYLVVGFADGHIPALPMNLVLLKGASIIGVFLGQAEVRDPHVVRGVEEAVARLAGEGRIRPHVTARYPLQAAGSALRALLERRVIGKSVLLPHQTGATQTNTT
jgi:NADPH:quinone reductase